MRQIFAVIILSLYIAGVLGQEPAISDITPKLMAEMACAGLNDSALLNESESSYLNFAFKKSRNHFDFTDKKIIFIHGNSGNDLRNKADYFKQVKDSVSLNRIPSRETILVFSQWERVVLGVDAAILYDCDSNLSIMNVRQTLLNSAGTGDYINPQEAMLLNEIASDSGIDIDFSGKKIAFFEGINYTGKHQYIFDCRYINWDMPSLIAPPTLIYILDEEEKSRTNGYDAIFSYGATKRKISKGDLIRQLSKINHKK